MTARIPPGTRSDVGLLGWIVSAISGRVSGTAGPPNLFMTLGRHRRLFLGWLHFAGRLMPGGKLPRRETELVILRVALLRDCAYEFDHHTHLGRKAGITTDEVNRLRGGPDADAWSAWSPRERAILLAADALHHRRDLSDGEWGELRRHVDQREAIELVMLVGHYEMLATTIAALRIEPDRRARA